MADRKEALKTELQKGLDATVGLYRSLSPQALAVQVYSEEVEWTVKQVLAHFITIERSMQWLFKDILAGGPGSPRTFDVLRFNQSQPQKLDHLDLDELIENFTEVRGQTIAMVEGMTEADLDREGHHAFHGPGRLERFIRWAYEHARYHEEDIRAAFKEAGISQD